MNEYRIVIDQSTSGTKVILFETEDTIQLIDRLDKSHKQIYPKKSWIEHDPQEILKNTLNLIDNICIKNNITFNKIKSISITNQRESIVLWDKVTGKAHTNLMVWSCNRGLNICEELIDKNYSDVVRNKTGLNIDPYFSGSKLKWFFDNNQLTDEELNNLAIGTVDSWLVWNLSEEKHHLTDVSNASRTLLFNIHSQQWDEELTQIFNVPYFALPEVLDSDANFGTFRGIPIVSVIADSQSALLGSGCLDYGETKATLGTGSSILVNIGSKINIKESSILTTIAWKKDNNLTYALEGVIRSYGDILNWIINQLELYDNHYIASEDAFRQESNEGVYFVPALEGLGAPLWMPEAHASFVGITRSTNKKHIIRAAFESMAFQTRMVLDAIEKEQDIIINKLNVDGGLTNNTHFIQLLADITQKQIVVNDIEEASALGTLLVLGTYSSEIDVESRIYLPRKNMEKEYQEWEKIVNEII